MAREISNLPNSMRVNGFVLSPETYYTTREGAENKAAMYRADGKVAEVRPGAIGEKEIYVIYTSR